MCITHITTYNLYKLPTPGFAIGDAQWWSNTAAVPPFFFNHYSKHGHYLIRSIPDLHQRVDTLHTRLRCSEWRCFHFTDLMSSDIQKNRTNNVSAAFIYWLIGSYYLMICCWFVLININHTVIVFLMRRKLMKSSKYQCCSDKKPQEGLLRTSPHEKKMLLAPSHPAHGCCCSLVPAQAPQSWRPSRHLLCCCRPFSPWRPPGRPDRWERGRWQAPSSTAATASPTSSQWWVDVRTLTQKMVGRCFFFFVFQGFGWILERKSLILACNGFIFLNIWKRKLYFFFLFFLNRFWKKRSLAIIIRIFCLIVAFAWCFFSPSKHAGGPSVLNGS